MEAAITPLPIMEEDKKEETKIFQIISDKNKKYHISIIKKNNNILINSSYEENSINFIFEGSYSFKDLKKYKIFYGFDTFEEILDEIYNLIDNKKVNILEYENKIDFIILLPFKIEDKLIFSLDKKITDKQIIYEQKLKIDELDV